MDVRGDVAAVADASASPSEQQWFASVDGAPIGPLSTEELVSRVTTGVLDWDAHVWREGYAEWKTLDASDTLVRAVAASRSAISEDSRPDSTERTTTPPLEDDAFANGATQSRHADDADDDRPTIAGLDDSPTRVAYDETPTRMYAHSAPPAAQLQPVARSAFASRPPGSIAPVSAHAVLSESSPNVLASSPRPLPSVPNAEPPLMLTGGMQPLPIGGQRALPSAPPARLSGYAAGEGSGLIDIRALASLAQSRMGASASARPMSIAGGIAGGVAGSVPAGAAAGTDVAAYELAPEPDPLASFGAGNGVAFAALDSLAPVAQRPRAKDPTVPLAILAGAAMIAAASFAAVYLTRPLAPASAAQAIAEPSIEPSAAAQPVGSQVPSEVASREAAEVTVAAAASPTQAVLPTEADAPEPALLAARDPDPSSGVEAALEPAPLRANGKAVAAVRAAPVRAGRASSAKATPSESVAATSAPAEVEPAAPPSLDDVMLDGPAPKAAVQTALVDKPVAPATPADRSIDALLEGAVASSKAAPTAAPPAASTSPSRDQVLAAMRGIEDEVRACAANEATPVVGTANVAVTVIGATGRVTGAEVTGIAGPVGSCIARVARTAKFDPFTRERFSVTYPYRFK